MGWEKGGRYYTRSRKKGGRVMREYVGCGRVAELAAGLDALQRAHRQAERATRQAEKADLEALDADLNRLIELTDLVTRAALLAAGSRQHKRGAWRKRRGNHKRSDSEGPDRSPGIEPVCGACPERR